jgi:hypothetical protein
MALKMTMRRTAAVTFAIILTSGMLAAQAQAPAKIETFSGTTVNLNPGSGEELRINVFKWATNTERDALVAIVKKDESGIAAALEKSPTVGIIWGSWPYGYSVRYAQRVQTADGGERIILITERPLGSRGRAPWKPAAGVTVPDYAFTLIELRLNKAGRGEGKMSLAAKVIADANGETLTLENYAAAPVLITNVRRVASNTRAGGSGAPAAAGGDAPARTR